MTWSKGGWLIGIALFVLMWAWWSSKENSINENLELKEHKKAIELLFEQNKSLTKENQLLDTQRNAIQLKADSLQQSLELKSKAIKQLKRIKNEKIKAIDNYSNDKLFQFFSGLPVGQTGVNTDSTAVK